MSLKRTGVDTAAMLYMIVHSESSLWQVRKAQNAELGGSSMDKMGAKRLEWQAGGKRRGRHPEQSLAWREICFERRERNWFMEGSVRWAVS